MALLRWILFPFSLVYGSITWVRNKLFDWEILEQYTIQSPSISVGNLSVGGTGKTPHVQYLAQHFTQLKTPFSIVSRGYGRQTKGLRLAEKNESSRTIGDEPMMYYQSFPEASIWVSEKRVHACRYIDKLESETQVILLDDAFQHRHVKPGLQVLLTAYNDLFLNDFILPTGNLREFKSGAKRADVIIVTKCPEDLSESAKEKLRKKLSSYCTQIYFSQIQYGQPKSFEGLSLDLQPDKILLVTAIANSRLLLQHLEKKHPNCTIEEIKFKDHHEFTSADLTRIQEIFGNFAREKSILITTEKDAVKLAPLLQNETSKKLPWFIQNIEIKIDKEIDFLNQIDEYVRKVSGVR